MPSSLTTALRSAFRDTFTPEPARLRVRPVRGATTYTVDVPVASARYAKLTGWPDEASRAKSISYAEKVLARRIEGLTIVDSQALRVRPGCTGTVRLVVDVAPGVRYPCREGCGRMYCTELSAMICPAVHGPR